MSKQDKQSWSAPKVDRIGSLRDVAQGPAPVNQANNNKRS